MTQPNWDIAPEGATHHVADCTDPWHKIVDGEAWYWSARHENWLPYTHVRRALENVVRDGVPRPVEAGSPEWPTEERIDIIGPNGNDGEHYRQFPALGYERLHAVYRDAHDHAAYTKGKERHANDLPFHEQRMQTISQGLNSPDGMAFQVIKKLQEGIQMKDAGARRRELLGAANYLAGIVIFLDDREAGGDV